jgi:hypothetical protein
LSLVLNARDAMPHGGMIAVQLANRVLNEGHLSTHTEARPGESVMLEVRDDKGTSVRVYLPRS